MTKNSHDKGDQTYTEKRMTRVDDEDLLENINQKIDKDLTEKELDVIKSEILHSRKVVGYLYFKRNDKPWKPHISLVDPHFKYDPEEVFSIKLIHQEKQEVEK